MVPEAAGRWARTSDASEASSAQWWLLTRGWTEPSVQARPTHSRAAPPAPPRLHLHPPESAACTVALGVQASA